MQRQTFDRNEPHGKMSLANLRNNFKALHQMDMLPLRPRASYVVEEFEQSTNALMQADWAGTGVTVTSEASVVEKGNYSLKMVVDGTGSRTVSKTQTFVLDAFKTLRVWEQCSSGASAVISLYLKDSNNDESYWYITTGATSTWKQDDLVLASPDGNSGSACDLDDIVEWGFTGLPASQTFYIDTVQGITGMDIAVEGTEGGDFYKNVYISKQPISASMQASPTLTAPSANSRIDILTINSSGTLAWVTGAESATPSPDWSTLTDTVIPIALVYCKTTMTSVLDYENKDTDTDQGYIYSDLRPFLRLGLSTFTALSDTPASITADYKVVGASDGSSLIMIEDISTFAGLSDTPSTFSGQGLKQVRVNTGATALEFFNQAFLGLSDTPSAYTGKASSLLAINAGETAIEFVPPTDAGFWKLNSSGAFTDTDDTFDIPFAPSNQQRWKLCLDFQCQGGTNTNWYMRFDDHDSNYYSQYGSVVEYLDEVFYAGSINNEPDDWLLLRFENDGTHDPFANVGDDMVGDFEFRILNGRIDIEARGSQGKSNYDSMDWFQWEWKGAYNKDGSTLPSTDINIVQNGGGTAGITGTWKLYEWNGNP